MSSEDCVNCGRNSGFFGKDIMLYNKSGEELRYCKKCYKTIPKEEKLVLDPIDKKTGSGINIGYAFGLAGGSGYAIGQMEGMMKPIKQYNLKLDEINEFAIMNFNEHFAIAKMDTKASILARLGVKRKKEKLDELAKKQYLTEYEKLDRPDKKIVKKEWKNFTKKNIKNNKHLKNLEVFFENGLGEN